MSRWSDQLKIGLCAEHIAWVRIAGGFRPRIIEQRIIEFAGQPVQPNWKRTLEALAEALKVPAGKADAFVTLSNRFVRYAIVPWHDALMKQDERLVQARQCFRQIYGDNVDKWTVGISAGGYRQPVLATAVDRELIDGLRAAFSGGRMRLASVCPYLTAAYGRYRGALGKEQSGTAYFGVVEQEDVGALHFDAGQLRGVFNQRIRGDWTQELNGMLLQSAGEGAADAKNPGICILAPGREREPFQFMGTVTRLALPALPGTSSTVDARMTMAISSA